MGDEHSDSKGLDLSLSLKVSNSIIPPSPTPQTTTPSPSFTFRNLQFNGNGNDNVTSYPYHHVPLPSLCSPLPSLDSLTNQSPLSSPNSLDSLSNTTSRTITHRLIHRSRRNGGNNSVGINSSELMPQEYVVETIEPPFPWSTTRPAGIHTISHLTSVGIDSVVGELMCRRCERRESFSYDLCSKFKEVSRFVSDRSHGFHDRAPPEWMNPVFPDCVGCSQNCMRPVLADRNEMINWLFLFLGQTLGVCTLEQLKWFCKHTGNHRTGAKDRVLYLSYIAICKQLQPDGTFEHLININDN